MKGFYLIDRVKGIVTKHAPAKDKRVKCDPLLFLVNFIFQFMGDSKLFSIESIRRSVNSMTGSAVTRSTFWGKLATKRLSKILSACLNDTTELLAGNCGVNPELLASLGVTGVSFFDSTSVTLKEKSKGFFDGTFTAAAIKFHLGLDGLTGQLNWCIFTAASIHDNCVFPNISSLVGRLSIFDLGYFDWPRFKEMKEAGAIFLSRLKINSSITIDEVISGLGKKHIGKKLKDIKFGRSRGGIIEFFTLRKIGKDTVKFRVIGFWNPALKRCHWYVTNLECSASIIAPLYAMRWQIELLIKGAKQSLNLNQVPSANEKIILNICTARLIAICISLIIFRIGKVNLKGELQNSVSLQRAAMVLANLSTDFINYISNSYFERKRLLKKRLGVLLSDLHDPNYRNRKSSAQCLIDLACKS